MESSAPMAKLMASFSFGSTAAFAIASTIASAIAFVIAVASVTVDQLQGEDCNH